MKIAHAGPVRTAAASVMLGAILGCGTNATDLVGQYVESLAQTAVDQWLTVLVSQDAGTPIEPIDDDPTPGDGDTGNSGDLVRGGELYSVNSCGGCHCPDASGGCALSAPAIIAASVESLTSILDAASGHPTQPELSETDMDQLAAYLATLIPG